MTVPETIEKYEGLCEQEGVTVVKAIYRSFLADLQTLASEKPEDRSRRLLQERLNAMDLDKAFYRHDVADGALVCRSCGKVCWPGDLTFVDKDRIERRPGYGRRAFDAAGSGVVCTECLTCAG